MEQGREVLDQIRERIDIVQLVSRYIELKRAGRNFTARCPFHNEKSPSFIVSPEIQRYKCFGCGKSGDIFTFVMEYEHIDFKEALEKLGKEAGVKIEHHQSPEGKKYAILEMINKLAADFFHNKLDESVGAGAKKYLNDRGLDQQMITRFNLGYSHGDGTLLAFLRKQANFTDEQLLASGLFSIREGTKQMKEKFFRRVMFPIQNDRGKVIAFSGRTMPGNDLGPKYLNSPDTPIFHKKNAIYGLFQAKTEMRKNDLCILLEGQIDTISSNKFGIKNVVAPQGTALTEEQVALIKRFTNNVLLFFDNDEAGQHAVERGFALCSAQNMNIFAANTGKYKDIDEALQNEPEVITNAIENKQDAFTYLVAAQLQKLDITKYEDNRKLVNFIKNLLQSVPDVSIRNFYMEKAEKLTGINRGDFTPSATNTSHNRYRDPLANDTQEKPVEHQPGIRDPKKRFTPEEYYLYLILHSEKYEKVQNIDYENFGDEIVKTTLKVINGLIEKEQKVDGKVIMKALEENTHATILLEAILLNNPTNSVLVKEINDVYGRIKLDGIKRQITKLRQKMSIEEAKNGSDSTTVDELSSKIATLMVELKKIQAQ